MEHMGYVYGRNPASPKGWLKPFLITGCLPPINFMEDLVSWMGSRQIHNVANKHQLNGNFRILKWRYCTI